MAKLKTSSQIIDLFRDNWKGSIRLTRRQKKKYLKRLTKSNNPEGLIIAASHCWFKDEKKFDSYHRDLLVKAVNQDYAPAMLVLAEYYYQQDKFDKALPLYQRAAELNFSFALEEMSRAFYYGMYGFEKNQQLSQDWQSKSEHGIKWNLFDGFDANDNDSIDYTIIHI